MDDLVAHCVPLKGAQSERCAATHLPACERGPPALWYASKRPTLTVLTLNNASCFCCRPPLLPDGVGVLHDAQVCTTLSMFPTSPPLRRSHTRRVANQGVVALALSSDDTRLAVHHGGGVDIHHVASFMQGQPPQQRLCVGQPPRLFSWYVPCSSSHCAAPSRT